MSTNNSRYQGAFTLNEVPEGLFNGAPAPVAPPPAPNPPPAPAQPAPNPAPSGDPFEEGYQDAPGKRGVKILAAVIWITVGAVLIFAIFALFKWAIPSWTGQPSQPQNPSQTQGTNSDPASNPSSSQGSDDSQDGEPSSSQATDTPALTVAEQAAIIDPWFKDVLEGNWETKTSSDLNGSPTTPLGQFCRDFCVVLKDGTVIARGTSESGERVAIVLSDYTVPTEWNGMGVVLDSRKIDLTMIIAQVPSTPDQQPTGAVWQWDNATASYNYLKSGSSSKYE